MERTSDPCEILSVGVDPIRPPVLKQQKSCSDENFWRARRMCRACVVCVLLELSPYLPCRDPLSWLWFEPECSLNSHDMLSDYACVALNSQESIAIVGLDSTFSLLRKIVGLYLREDDPEEKITCATQVECTTPSYFHISGYSPSLSTMKRPYLVAKQKSALGTWTST